jgi:hypothetical protein
MKTEDLVAGLGRSNRPVDRGIVVRSFGIALVVGIALALCAAIVLLGTRPDLATARTAVFVAVKLAFSTTVFALSALYLLRLARPGGEYRVSPALMAAPFVAVVGLAGAVMIMAPTSHWDRMVMGDQWLECLVSIPIIAVAPFAAVIWAARRAAPTDLVRAGAFAGLVAGSISAMAYALHCTDDSLPFVAVWYGGTIALCTLAVAMLGPRLLRW